MAARVRLHILCQASCQLPTMAFSVSLNYNYICSSLRTKTGLWSCSLCYPALRIADRGANPLAHTILERAGLRSLYD
jgi:hypothetical protein